MNTFVVRQACEFPVTSTTQIPLVTSSLLIIFSSCSMLRKPTPLPSQKHTHFLKCLHHITSQIHTTWSFCSENTLKILSPSWSLWLSHTLLLPLSLPSHLFINFSSQRSFFLIFSSTRTSWKDCAMTDCNVLRTLPIPSPLNHSLISVLDTSLFPSHNWG
jgi:hypothetical protein